VVSRALLVVSLVTAAMGLGGLHWAALVPSSLLALGAGFFAVRSLPGRAPYAPAMIPVALCAFTLLQLVPLPLGVLGVLSPRMVEVWQGAISPFGEELRWGSLSADPRATLTEALKWASYAGVMAAAIAAGSRRGVRFGAMVLLGCAVLLSTTTLAHGILNVTRVYGIYIPTFGATRWRVGPILNPNNLAGYLNLGLFSGLGLMLSRTPGVPRVALGITVATLVAVVVLGASRAGLAATVIGLCVFGVLAFGVRRAPQATGRLSPLGLFAGIGGVVAFAVLLAWLGGSRETWHTLFDKNIEKIDVMAKILPLVVDHPFFGVGRGAFESVFPAYHFGAANVVYSHPENFIVQWIAEWGIPVGGLALLAFGIVVYVAFRDARRSVTGAGVWAGIVAVLLQNLLDLGLELPGLAFATVTGLGILWGHDQRDALEGVSTRRRHLAPRLVAWGVLGLGLGLAFCVAAFARSNVTKDRIRIRDAVAHTRLHDPRSHASTRAALRQAMLEHPADPYFPRVGGVLAWYSGENPMPWIARSLDRGIGIGQTHFALARILAKAGVKEQALLELRLACTYADGLSSRAGRLLLSLTHDRDEIASAVPDGVAGAPILFAAAMNVKLAEEPVLRLSLLAEAIERRPQDVNVRSRFVEDVSAAISAKWPGSPCTGERREACEAVAMEQIEAIEKLGPESPAGILNRARFLMALGHVGDAELLLRRGCGRFSSVAFANCQRQRVAAASLTRSRDLLDAASRDLAGAGCTNAHECADLYRFLGGQAEGLGDTAHAFGYYKRAAVEEPNRLTLSALARTASALGDEATARNALSQLQRADPGDQRVQQALDAQRRRLMLASPPPR
jgi:hypothetical protein